LEANEQCLRVSQDFFEFLTETKLLDSNKPWKVVRAVVRSIRAEKKIKELTESVKDARAGLTLSLLVYLSSPKYGSSINSTHRHEVLTQMRKIEDTASGMQQDIDDMVMKMSRFEFSSTLYQYFSDDFNEKYKSALQQLSAKLEKSFVLYKTLFAN
jgi:hypothetical protein